MISGHGLMSGPVRASGHLKLPKGQTNVGCVSRPARKARCACRLFPEITPLLREHNFVSTTQKSRERYHFGYSGAPTIPKKSISLDLRMIETSLFARRRIEFFANVGAVIFRGTLSKKLLSDLAHTYTKRARAVTSLINAPDINFALWRSYVFAKANIACVETLGPAQRHCGQTEKQGQNAAAGSTAKLPSVPIMCPAR